LSDNGFKILIVSFSISVAFLVVGIDILTSEVDLSTTVVIAPFLPAPTIVSISQSPTLLLASTILSL